MRKFVTSVKISSDIHRKMQHTVIEDGYGMRGKSKWVIGAIEEFLALENYPEYVDIASESSDFNEILSISLSDNIITLLDQAVIKVRERYLSMEGVKSNIIRASIIQKLIR